MHRISFVFLLAIAINTYAQNACNLRLEVQLGEKYWGTEVRQVNDAHTGRERLILTDRKFNSLKLYQTHPNWAADGNWIIFTSTRTGQKEIFAVNSPGSDDCFDDFSIIQLTTNSNLKDRPGSTPDVFVSQDSSGLIYFLSRPMTDSIVVFAFDFNGFLEDVKGERLRDSYKKRITSISRQGEIDIFGGLTLDASSTRLYLGLRHGLNELSNEILSVDVGSGVQKSLYHTTNGPSICHLQANPWKSQELLFCQNDLHQRMYLMNTETGEVEFLRKGLSRNRAMDNVSHETWYDKNTIAFNLNSVHPDHQDKLDIGVYLIDKSNAGNPSALGSLLVSSPDTTLMFLHQASRDGLMIGDLCRKDDYNVLTGEIWKYTFDVAKPNQGELQLLTRDTSRLSGTHAHQSISPDGKWVLIGARESGHQLMLVSLE